MIVVPSILSDSLDDIQHMLDRVANESSLKQVQIDIVDPDFAEDVTVHPIDLLELTLPPFKIDFHLMTNDPINDVIECSQIPGAHTIIAQIERMPSQRAYIEHVESLKLHSGLSLDLTTPVEEIDHSLLSKINIIQVMGNKAGRQGQPFLAAQALEKIAELVQIKKNQNASFLIAVDIGMTPENARLCEERGAQMVAPGSYLWNSKHLQDAIEAYH